jgi:WD40 repeat protein
MYMLTCSDGYQYRDPGGVYVLDVIPCGSGLAAISSNQTISLFNPLFINEGPVKVIRTNHGNLSTARVYNAGESIIATTGENGSISLWDLRLDPGNALALQLSG